MIELQKNYVLTLTEYQARELYMFLDRKKTAGFDDQSVSYVYRELKSIFDIDRSWGGEPE